MKWETKTEIPDIKRRWYFCKVLNKITGDIEKSVIYHGDIDFDIQYPFEVLEWLDESESQDKEAVEGWISVKDGLPDNSDNVLAYSTNPYNENCSVEVSFCDELDKQWKGSPSYFTEGITHWRPLPAPPQQ